MCSSRETSSKARMWLSRTVSKQVVNLPNANLYPLLQLVKKVTFQSLSNAPIFFQLFQYSGEEKLSKSRN